MNWTELANSEFTTSLVGALAGAFAGAYGAQRVTERAKLREDLQKEIRNTSAAIGLAFGITGSALAAKSQHYLPMRQAYQLEKLRYKKWIEKRELGLIQGNAPFDLNANLQSVPGLFLAIEPLQEIVFSKITAPSRAINLAAALREYHSHLTLAIARRESILSEARAGKLPPGAEIIHIYLGLKFGNGSISREFEDVIDAIYKYCDILIFFSSRLAEDLHEHGKTLKGEYRKMFSDIPPPLARVDLTKASDRGLMPNAADYEEWLSAFRESDSPPAWWQRSA